MQVLGDQNEKLEVAKQEMHKSKNELDGEMNAMEDIF
jgi:hypothetical protein